ncbi:MAG: ribbon-helix-helix protein, CopG family [Candidatus Eremiobacterota bacterium]
MNDKYSRRLEIRIDGERFALLRQKAKETRKSIAELIREAIDKQYKWASISRKLHALEKLKEISVPITNWSELKEDVEEEILLKNGSL